MCQDMRDDNQDKERLILSPVPIFLIKKNAVIRKMIQENAYISLNYALLI